MWNEIKELAQKMMDNSELIKEYGEEMGTSYVDDILKDISREIAEVYIELASIKDNRR